MTNNILNGKKGIILGPIYHNSIAYSVAKEVSDAGADIILADAPENIREELGQLANDLNCKIYPADGNSLDSVQHLLDYAHEMFESRFDFIFYDNNSREKEEAVVSTFNRLLQSVYSNDVIKEWGSIVNLKRSDFNITRNDTENTIKNNVTQSISNLFWSKRRIRVNNISFPHITSSLSIKNCAAMATILFSNFTKDLTLRDLKYTGDSTTEMQIRSLINKELT